MQVVTRLLLCVFIMQACATGGSSNPGDDTAQKDAPAKQDAPAVSNDARPIDAPMTPIDARPIDAPPPPIDAPAPTTCAINNDCTVPGTCCFFFTCVPGTAVGENVCFKS